VQGGDGNDRIWPGWGADVENGGAGDDVLHALANDDKVDRIDCGDGNDVVWLNANEQDVHVNCETVMTKAVTGSGGDD
jgi:Ca2+-binding RTX toxin-like protein